MYIKGEEYFIVWLLKCADNDYYNTFRIALVESIHILSAQNNFAGNTVRFTCMKEVWAKS